ncbi:MAG: hypothetical protein ABEN55_16045, partial [Bradymonadaceae bacterium]
MPARSEDRHAFLRAEIQRRLELLESVGDDRDKQKTVLAHSKEHPLRWIRAEEPVPVLSRRRG